MVLYSPHCRQDWPYFWWKWICETPTLYFSEVIITFQNVKTFDPEVKFDFWKRQNLVWCVNVMFYFYQMVTDILRLIQRSFLLKPILRVCWCLTLYFTCQRSQLGYLAVSFFRSVQNACLKPPEQRRNILRLFSRITRIWVYWWWSFWLQWICVNVMLYFLLDENKISNWKIFAKKGLTQCFWNKKFSISNTIVM